VLPLSGLWSSLLLINPPNTYWIINKKHGSGMRLSESTTESSVLVNFERKVYFVIVLKNVEPEYKLKNEFFQKEWICSKRSCQFKKYQFNSLSGEDTRNETSMQNWKYYYIILLIFVVQGRVIKEYYLYKNCEQKTLTNKSVSFNENKYCKNVVQFALVPRPSYERIDKDLFLCIPVFHALTHFCIIACHLQPSVQYTQTLQ